MVNFSERTVRLVSIIVFILFLILGAKKHWFFVLEIIPIMIFFSTKGVQMFENSLWWGARVFWGLCFSIALFVILYRQIPEMIVVTKQYLMVRALMAVCVGAWLGDFFAKYIYIRLRFCVNRFASKGYRNSYKILSMKDYSQQYIKSPFKRMKVSFYYVGLEVDGVERIFLTEKEIFEQLQHETTIEITIKRGCLGSYYGVGYEKKY
ncbi:hypothetical protein HMPREF3206_01184 [Fusobacterium equinum]|uniref:Uncharacterized protein n=1 Tax=Fusobacterium equinum TaxID=134605 RepID=A0A133NC47_9FUSO|nr:hypothetical protein [Fusobacterium equinum]KXA13875.1 hypothetical protein HMPREF3206_01184 [Fusobacterium equinum]